MTVGFVNAALPLLLFAAALGVVGFADEGGVFFDLTGVSSSSSSYGKANRNLF